MSTPSTQKLSEFTYIPLCMWDMSYVNKCFTAHLQSLQQLGFCCGRRQFVRPHYAHHLEEIWKGNCVHLSFKQYRPLAIHEVHQVLHCSYYFSKKGNWSPSTGVDWKHPVNQVAKLLDVIPLLPLHLQTSGVVACSTPFEGRIRLCSEQSDVSKSFPRCFQCERGKQNGRFPIFSTFIDT